MKPRLAFPLLVAFLSFSSAQGAAVVIPYSTNFDSGVTVGSASDTFQVFNAGTGGSSAIVSGDLRQTISASAVNGASSTAASVTHANADFVGGFRVSTTFTVDSYTVGPTGVVNVSLNAFSTTSDLGTGYRLIYTLSGTNPGTLTIQNIGGALTTTNNPAASSFISPSSGGTPVVITLTLTGTFSGTTLNLTGTASAGSSLLTATGVDTPGNPSGNTVTLGDYFGVRSALAVQGTAGTSSETVTFTNFSLEAIPEPTSVALFALAGAGLGLRRRRNG